MTRRGPDHRTTNGANGRPERRPPPTTFEMPSAAHLRAAADRAVARAARPAAPRPPTRPPTRPASARPTRSADVRRPATGGTKEPAARPAPRGRGASERPVQRISSNPVRSRPAASSASAKPTARDRLAGGIERAANRGYTLTGRRAAAPPPPPRGRVERVVGAARTTATATARGVAAVNAFFNHTAPQPHGSDVVHERLTRQRTGRRLYLTLVVILLAFVLIVWKLVDLQVLSPDPRLKAFGESQRMRTETLAADRGSILDRDGVALALSTPEKSVFVDAGLIKQAWDVDHPEAYENPRAKAVLLADALRIPGVDADMIEKKMTAVTDKGDPVRFSYVARQLDAETVARVKALHEAPDPQFPGNPKKTIDLLKGVAFYDEPKRFVPSGDLAKSIIGQVDIDGLGISGLEKMYGDDLTGQPGKLVLERNPEGRTIAAAEPQLIPAVKGRDVQLTIDRSMQFETERILADQVVAAGAAHGIAVVMKPDTGEVLSMASVDGNPAKGTAAVSSDNEALTNVIEPGSVMKIVAASAAIEEKKVEPDTVIPLTDTIQICDAQFSEHDYHGNVGWPVSKILEQSSNVGAIKLGQMVGRHDLHSYLEAYGFGQRTAINFPNEQKGILKNPDDPNEWWCSTDGTVPIGMGISVTPVQMLGAYNTIANGGRYVAPKLVQATIDGDGNRHPTPIDEGRQVISQDTANKMNIMLRGVVAEGTGTAANISGYNVAGKTGTARKPQPGGGYIGADGLTHYVATFVGFMPAEAPTLSVIVVIDDPSKQGIYGGVVAAPAFAKIGEAALRHYHVPPPASDLAAGGAKTDPSANDPRKTTTTTGLNGERGIEHLADGRVRAPAAGDTTTTAVGAGATGTSGSAGAGSGATTATTAATVTGAGRTTPVSRPPTTLPGQAVATTTVPRSPTTTTRPKSTTTLPAKKP